MFGFFRRRKAAQLRALFRNASSLDPDTVDDAALIAIWRTTSRFGVQSWREDKFIWDLEDLIWSRKVDPETHPTPVPRHARIS